jgi:glycosyltransferase involved in cell wall biosynthesis
MKVAFLTGSLSRQGGGLFPILKRLSAELADRAWTIEAFGTDDSDYVADRDGWRGARTSVFKPLGPARLAYVPEMTAALERGHPDLVHLHGIWMGVSASNHRWHRKTGRPYLISAHGMLDRWAVAHQQWKKRLVGWLYENRNLRDAACLHALSEQEVQDYRNYGLRNPVAVIPNGVDLPDESARAGEPPWRGTIPDGARVLLFMGRLHGKKGLLELLDGWKQCGAARRDWRLMIAGWDDGGHQAAIAQRIAMHGLAEEVRVIGPQFGAAKEACLAGADAFILPSHSEGLPVAVLEAWAHRLPALLTPACNLPEGFASGAAIRIEAQPDSIAGGLETLFAMDETARKEMGGRGRELIATSFTWPAITEKMTATYRWMLGKGERPACVC